VLAAPTFHSLCRTTTANPPNVLCGVRYQIQHAEGKLVRVAQGEVFEVAK
jgi:dTDP-4-dehydrorhamnose 3,5-epimerase-like enzyme